MLVAVSLLAGLLAVVAGPVSAEPVGSGASVVRPVDPVAVTAPKEVLPDARLFVHPAVRPNQAPLSPGVDESTPSAPLTEVDRALADARASGRAVEVVGRRDESSSLFANPGSDVACGVGGGTGAGPGRGGGVGGVGYDVGV